MVNLRNTRDEAERRRIAQEILAGEKITTDDLKSIIRWVPISNEAEMAWEKLLSGQGLTAEDLRDIVKWACDAHIRYRAAKKLLIVEDSPENRRLVRALVPSLRDEIPTPPEPPRQPSCWERFQEFLRSRIPDFILVSIFAVCWLGALVKK